MHFRKLALLLGVLSLLFTAHSTLALGLGEITLNSSLNQPLDAEVSLIDIGELSADQIIVKLASQEDFDRAGLDRLFFYSKMRFEVITSSGKSPHIKITSRETAVEPFLSFILEARWSSGRLLHEYTVLLDLPVFSNETPRAVERVSTPRSAPLGKTEPVRTRSASRSSVSGDSTRGKIDGDVYGPVNTNDTLWEIALKVRRDGASVYQTMLALQRANPEAFINNNINLLRAGYVLRIPTVADIKSINTREAAGDVATQNRQWANNDMGAELDASGRRSSVTRSTNTVSGRVKLAASGDSTRGSGGSYGDGEAYEQEIAAVEEELERSRSENEELQSRTSDLEEQIKTMESLLEVSNAQLQALELAAQRANADEDEANDNAQVDPLALIEDVASTDGDLVTDADWDSDASVTETDDSTAPIAEPVEVVAESVIAPVVVRKAPEPSFMDKVMDNILWVVGGIVALLLVGVMALRKSNDDEHDEFDEDFDQPFDGESFDEVDDAESATESATEEIYEEEISLDLDIEEEVAEAVTGDVVSEADIYISLEQYEQAESMLTKGLASEPSSLPIQLKLLEVYSETQDLEVFDSYYGRILESGDADSISRAKGLRAHFVGAPEFAVTTSDVTVEVPEESAEMDFDSLDLDLDLDAVDEVKEDSLALDDAFDLELDLDLDLDDSLGEEALSLDGDDDLLDLSLGLDEGAEPELALDADELSFDLDADLSFESDEPEIDTSELDGLDLDLDLGLEDETVAETESIADELGDLSLDDLSLEVALGESESLEDSDDALDIEFEGLDLPTAEDDDLFDGGEALEAMSASLDDLVDSSDVESEVSETVDLSEDDADDFDLDKAMGDINLDELDKEMADLDFESLDLDDEDTIADIPVVEEPAAEAQSFEVDDDDVFDAALSDVDLSGSLDLADLPTPEEAAATADDDDDDDFLADSDEAATKLDLARAYIDMGDIEGAKDILSEVAQEGTEPQRADANALIESINS